MISRKVSCCCIFIFNINRGISNNFIYEKGYIYNRDIINEIHDSEAGRGLIDKLKEKLPVALHIPGYSHCGQDT